MCRAILYALILMIPQFATAAPQLDDLARIKLKAATEEILAKAKSDILMRSRMLQIGLLGSVTVDSPYCADFVTESNQVLSDGTSIYRTNSYRICRDSSGRLRRESGSGEVWVADPVKNVGYLINESSREAYTFPLAVVVLNPRQSAIVRIGAARDPQPITLPRQLQSTDPIKTEPLGRRIFEGVESIGMRTIETIPVGAIGNNRSLQVVSERWFSPELQIQLMSRRTDPRTGDTISRILRLSRNEPPAEFFTIPSGYKLTAYK